jgi:hypothetical protein
MNIFCPIKSSEEYLEMMDVFKDDTRVHGLWNKNKGNPLDLDPWGNPSLLFEELMEYTGGDRAAAMRLKATAYSEAYFRTYGDWTETQFDPKQHDVYENGEPFMDTFLNIEYSENKKREHPDPQIQSDIDNYDSETIDNKNNSYVWELEKKFDLVDWPNSKKLPGDKWKTKVYNGFTFARALEIIKEIEKLGAKAYPIDVHYPGTNLKSKTGVRIIVDIGRPSKKVGSMQFSGETVFLAGQEFTVRHRDIPDIKDLVKRLTSGEVNATDFLNQLTMERTALIASHPELAESIRLLLDNRRKTTPIKVKVIKSDTNGNAMYYNSDDHTITVVEEALTSSPTLYGFISLLVHEINHAYLSEALDHPMDERDIQFGKTMKEVLAEYQKQPTKTNENAAKDVDEFLANFMTDPRLRGQLKEMRTINDTRSLFQKILDAISLFFLRYTGYRLRQEKGENLNDYVNKTVTDFMNARSQYRNVGINRTYDAKKTATVRQTIADMKSEIILSKAKPKTFFKVVKANLAKFKTLFNLPDNELHEYSVKGDPTLKFDSVTQRDAEAGFGISKEDMSKKEAEALEAIEKGSKIGSAVHYTADDITTGKIRDELIKQLTGYKLTETAKELLKDIIDEIIKANTYKGGSVLVLSEVVVADIDKKVAGTIDLVIIDHIGRVHLFDFKVHAGKHGFRYYASTNKRFGKNNMETYHLQLGAYKYLFENLTGLTVTDMNVVMLTPTIDKVSKEITTIALNRDYSERGIDTFETSPNSVNTVYGAGTVKYTAEKLEDTISADTDITSTPGYKAKYLSAEKETAFGEIYKKIMQAMDAKREIMKKRYSFVKRRGFEEHFNMVAQLDNTTEAIFNIIKFGYETTKKLTDRAVALSISGEFLTPEMLQEWHDYIVAYDSLDGLVPLLKANPKIFSPKGKEKGMTNEPTAMEMLDATIANKNYIKSVYTDRGKEAVAKRLVPYFDMLRVQRREELESFWRRLEYRVKHKLPLKAETKIEGKKIEGVLTPEEFAKYGKDIHEFVDFYMSKEKEDIDRATYEMLLKELSTAANDVGMVTRWADALVDTSDPISAAIVEAFSKADEASRIQFLDEKLKMLKILRRLEEWGGKTGSTSEQAFYKDLLELDPEGKITNFLIRPWYSDLDEEEKVIRSAMRNKEPEEAGKKLHAWITKNYPLGKNEERYHAAFEKFLNEKFTAHDISFQEMEALIDNEANAKLPVTVLTIPFKDEYGHIIRPALISEKAADIASDWKSKSRKRYSELDSRWINPQWVAFLNKVGVSTTGTYEDQYQALEKSEHPLAQFYTTIVKKAEEADYSIPYSYRLGYRLPGVYKTKNEMIRAGMSATEFFKENIKIDILKEEQGDIRRNSQEYTDERGHPKYFLPVHYVNKLTNEQQSYDLATIYLKYWESANDYANKMELLPTIEMAKHFVETRKTERRDSRGRRIVKAIQSIYSKEKDEAALKTTSNIAEQLGEWFQMYVYGNTIEKVEISLTDELTLDVQKFTDVLLSYTSLNLLAFNLVQATANVAIGETMQAIEAIAHEYMTPSEYTRATIRFNKELPGILGDVGRRTPENVISLIIQKFNATNKNQPSETDFANKNKMKALANREAFAFAQEGGEFEMRARLLLGILEHEVRAISKTTGKDIGPMIDQYYAEGGELKIKEDVDLKASKWTLDEQNKFGRRFRGIADRVHGSYSQEARVALQRYWWGKLGYMFRKFVIPGFRRRYGKQEYSQRLMQTTEGNYRTTLKFFTKLAKEIKGMNLALMGEEWAALSTHEKANIQRTISELSFITTYMIIGGVAYSHWSDGEDENDKRFWSFLAYQAYRLKAEMLFYTSPANAMAIMRSPFASMSVLENIGKLWQQMFSPMEVYERGPWKGHLKIERDIIQFIPIYKQYFKLRDNFEQIQWFR